MIKKGLAFGLILSGFVCFNSTALASTKIEPLELNRNILVDQKIDRPKYAPDEVLVKFKEGQVNLSNPGLMSLFREYNTRISNDLEKDEVLE